MAFTRVKQSLVELNDNKPQGEGEITWEGKKKKSKISVPDISKILICLIPLISAELHDFTPASKLVSSFFFFNLSSDEL